MISRLENDKRELTAAELATLSRTYGWDPREVLGVSPPHLDEALLHAVRELHDTHPSTGLEMALEVLELEMLLDRLSIPHRSAGAKNHGRAPSPRSPLTASEMGRDTGRRLAALLSNEAAIDSVHDVAMRFGIDVLVAPLADMHESVLLRADSYALAIVNSTGTSLNRQARLARAICRYVCDDLTAPCTVIGGEPDLFAERSTAFGEELLATLAPLDVLADGDLPGRVVERVRAAIAAGVIGATIASAAVGGRWRETPGSAP
jgi:hypothetical protein